MAGKFVENYKKRFVNPYNFIPLMESCSRSVPTAELKIVIRDILTAE